MYVLGLLRVSSLGLSPVDHVPDGLKVVGLDVLVLQVVGVLPSVNSNNGHIRSSHGVLVGSGDGLQSTVLLVLDNPSPSGTLDTSQLGVDVANQSVQRSKAVLDGIVQSRSLLGGLSSTLALGGQVLPEQRVVNVTTAVEVDQRQQLNLSPHIARLLGTGKLLNCLVVRVDIGLVVLGVVELVNLARNKGLQSTKVVVQVGQSGLASIGNHASGVGPGGHGQTRSNTTN